MATGGPTAWGRPFAREVWLEGLTFDAYEPPFSWQIPPLAGALQMADGSSIEPRIFLGGSAPSGMRPRVLALTIAPVRNDVEFRKLGEVEASGRSVAFFPSLPLPERWDAVQGQTHFSTARFLPYGTVSGVTLSTHPITAWLNDVPQTVVTSSPSTGEVQIVATSPLAQHNCVVTPALNAGDVLRIEHYPLHFVRIAVQATYVVVNELQWAGTFTEIFRGDYS